MEITMSINREYLKEVYVRFDNMLYKLDNKFLSELFSGGLICQPNHPERDALANTFAQSNCHHLQEIAAQSDGLHEDSVLKLAQSPYYKTKLLLSKNLDAIAKLDVEALSTLGQTDIKIAKSIILTLEDGDLTFHHVVAERLLEDYQGGQFSLYQRRLPSACTRAEIANLSARLMYHRPRNAKPGYRSYSNTMHMHFPPVPNRAYLCYGYSEFVLDSWEVTNIIDYLLLSDQTGILDQLTWFLSYPDLDVVEYVALRCKMKPEILEKFLKVSCRDVGMAAMHNESAPELSDRAIADFIGRDGATLAELLTDSFPKMCDRLLEVMEKQPAWEIQTVIHEYREELENRHKSACVDEDEDEDEYDLAGLSDEDDVDETGIGYDESDDLPTRPKHRAKPRMI